MWHVFISGVYTHTHTASQLYSDNAIVPFSALVLLALIKIKGKICTMSYEKKKCLSA